ncbi:MAG: hypothetical protein DLM68_09985 [Hyphomicrobiales bacterium]|nr:MAG: hypothetical protein DLM68_09985 [Hyphomicrobiales bacterium]
MPVKPQRMTNDTFVSTIGPGKFQSSLQDGHAKQWAARTPLPRPQARRCSRFANYLPKQLELVLVE